MIQKRVGLIGLGEMGMGMARNLLAAGFPLTGLDLREERRVLLKQTGGAVADSPADVGRASDVVVLMPFDAGQLLDVLQGADGLLPGMRPGGTVIVCATVGPAAMRRAAGLLEAKGLRWLDCPVSGGRLVAEAGALGLYAAGPAVDMEAQRDVLAAIGGHLLHVGEQAGQGQALKLASLLHYAVNSAGLMEALSLARRARVPNAVLREVFGGGGEGDGADHFRELADHVLARRFSGTDNQIRYTAKDLDLCLQMGRETGASLRVTDATFELVKAAAERFPDEDKQSLIKLLEG
ncbi:MAG: NAD(P)-dependent oxidoreductase [Anaerolineaceae bacterium]|nr:NAD(P)-dependent oxidoreductase [Anaerolineaceae bacterium]